MINGNLPVKIDHPSTLFLMTKKENIVKLTLTVSSYYFHVSYLWISV